MPDLNGPTEDTGCPPDLSVLSFGTPETLDVVTWNVEEFPKNGQTTVVAVADILQAMDVDLFALQEISGVPDFEQMVGQLPGWASYLDSKWYGGLAFLYRTDSIEVLANYEIYTTEEYWTPFPRSPQVMEFRFKAYDFVVINNHLKCCGDGRLQSGSSWDEEARRENAMGLLKEYVDLHFSDRRVFLLGDLNDSLTDGDEDNVFTALLNDSEHYRFADMEIAEGTDYEWSFPSYPSHIDHIAVTNELFGPLQSPSSKVSSILVDALIFDGWRDYERAVSDHRPVAVRLEMEP